MTDAYRLSGIGPSNVLLAPAYHCRTMIDPAIRLGAEVVLYRLNSNLSVDMQHLQDCMLRLRGRLGAVLVTHFFGFPQDFDVIRQTCESHGVRLIEDCSHCLFLPPKASRLGLVGHYCVSSPYKFFPMDDGGVLWANDGVEMPERSQQKTDFVKQAKALARAILGSMKIKKTPDQNALGTEVQACSRLLPSVLADPLVTSTEPSVLYTPSQEHQRPLAASLWVWRHTRIDYVRTRRRAHYLNWSDFVRPLPNCSALYPELPANVVPYMFPLLVDLPEVHFFVLKRLGVPIWRWDDMALSACCVALKYRTRLLHLPCHQALSHAHLEWMQSAVAQTLLLNSPKASS